MVPNGKQKNKTITTKVHFHFLQRNEGNFNDNHNSSILGSNGIAQVSVTVTLATKEETSRGVAMRVF